MREVVAARSHGAVAALAARSGGALPPAARHIPRRVPELFIFILFIPRLVRWARLLLPLLFLPRFRIPPRFRR